MSDLVEQVEDADEPARYLELFCGLESGHFTFKWLTPLRLRAIADDLVACDERDGDPADVLAAWQAAWLAEL